MLSLEEYIEKRKTEDGINEFDVSQKINNIRNRAMEIVYTNLIYA